MSHHLRLRFFVLSMKSHSHSSRPQTLKRLAQGPATSWAAERAQGNKGASQSAGPGFNANDQLPPSLASLNLAIALPSTSWTIDRSLSGGSSDLAKAFRKL